MTNQDVSNLFQHYKGSVYRAIETVKIVKKLPKDTLVDEYYCLAMIESTWEKVLVYQTKKGKVIQMPKEKQSTTFMLYQEVEDNKSGYWLRPAEEFHGDVEIFPNYFVKRFKNINLS